MYLLVQLKWIWLHWEMFLACFQYTILRIKYNIVAFNFLVCEEEDCNGGQTPSLSPPLSSSAVKFPQPSHDFLDQFTQLNSPNSGDRKHRDASAVLPFIGLTASKFTLYQYIPFSLQI